MSVCEGVQATKRVPSVVRVFTATLPATKSTLLGLGQARHVLQVPMPRVKGASNFVLQLGLN